MYDYCILIVDLQLIEAIQTPKTLFLVFFLNCHENHHLEKIIGYLFLKFVMIFNIEILKIYT